MDLLRISLTVTLFLVCLAENSRRAFAEPADDAEGFVRRGIELRRELKDAEALEEFQRAYRLVRTPRIEAQMGAAEQALGRWVDAEAHITSALAAGIDAWVAKNRATLEKSLTVIRTHLGNLEIIGAPAGAEVRVDGRSVGQLPLPSAQRVATGSVVIEVRAPGYFPVTRTVSVSPDELTRETVTLQSSKTSSNPVPSIDPAATNGKAVSDTSTPAEAPRPTDTSSPKVREGDPQSWRRPLAWTLAAGAVAFTVGGIVAVVIRSDKAESYNRLVDSNACTGAGAGVCSDLRSDGDRARTLSIVGFSIAGAAAIASTVLFLTMPTESGSGPTALGRCAPDVVARGIVCALAF